ncbi:MAG: trypsin-like serine protease [Polyangiaceae bacterium]
MLPAHRHPRHLAGVLGLAASVVSGCSSEFGESLQDPVLEEELGQTAAPITNGQLDTTHDAVVAVLSNGGSCSGTIIHVAGGYGYVLTAAHCGTPKTVVLGTNYASSNATKYQVVGFLKHPKYNQVLLDVMMVKFAGATASTPVIPAMPPGLDNLTAGTSITHVGYGKAGPAPGSNNSKRHQIAATLSAVQLLRIEYDVSNGGPCSGDSGGPQLVSSPEIVAGVTSGGDEGCVGLGVSTRVSAVHDHFIQPYLSGGTTQPLSCDACQQVSTSGDGSCKYKVDGCYNNPLCEELVTCLQACSTVFCQQICLDNHSAGIDIYNEIIDCVCQSGCASECAGDDYCVNGKLTKPGDTTSSGVTGAGVTTGATVGSGSSGSGVGSSSSIASTGAGSGWTAPGVADEDYDGIILTSCALRPMPAPSSPSTRDEWGVGLWLLALGLGWSRRRGCSRSV